MTACWRVEGATGTLHLARGCVMYSLKYMVNGSAGLGSVCSNEWLNVVCWSAYRLQHCYADVGVT